MKIFYTSSKDTKHVPLNAFNARMLYMMITMFIERSILLIEVENYEKTQIFNALFVNFESQAFDDIYKSSRNLLK